MMKITFWKAIALWILLWFILWICFINSVASFTGAYEKLNSMATDVNWINKTLNKYDIKINE